MRSHDRIARLSLSTWAVLSAAGASLACEISFNVSRGAAPTPVYAALCAALAFGPSLLLGLVAAPFRNPAVVLALWAGLCGAVAIGPIVGVGFGGVTLAALWQEPGSRNAAIRSGIAVALALCIAEIAWPRFASAVGLLPEESLWRDFSRVGIAATVLLGRTVALRFLRESGRFVEPLFAPVVFGLVFVALPMSSGEGRVQRTLPDYGVRAAKPTLPHVIVLVLDTVRADHLSIYGYERDTTPAMRDFMARSDRAVLYPFAFSPSPWTAPAHASLFTGLIPSDHGAHMGNGIRSFARGALTADRTLAEVLKKRGYATAGISANLQLFRVAGLERGFDVFYRPSFPRPLFMLGEGLRAQFLPWLMAPSVKPYPEAGTINREVLRFIDHCTPGPCFVLANYKEAHLPYVPRPPHAGVFSEGRPLRRILRPGSRLTDEENREAEARYDEEIRSLDERIGELLAELEERGILDRAWLVVTSDHGEAFGEHDLFGHQTGLHNDQVRIPLLVQPPRGESLSARRDAVDLLDVAATLAAVAGAEPIGDGRDLRDASIGPRPVQLEFFGEVDTEGSVPFSSSPARGVVVGLDKLIERRGEHEFYEIAEDPSERRDRSARDPGSVSILEGHLPPLRRGQAHRGERLSIEEEQELRALGYIQ